MARGRRKSPQTLARRMAAKRKQESPEQRAARLKSNRDYVRYRRENETESEREKRLKSMRCYVRNVRKQENAKMRLQRAALLIENIKKVEERSSDIHDSDTPKSPEVFVKIENEE